MPEPGEIHPFESWDEIDAIAAELDTFSGPLVIFLAITGARPEEAFGAEWPDVDLKRRVFMVRRGFAKGRLKDYGKTTGSRRAVPLRARVVVALERLPHRRGILFPASEGGRIDINNWAEPQLDAVARGGRDPASPDLRPAPHLRVVEPRGRRSTSSPWRDGWARA
jgi:integrase